jgi:hypothetical protein
VLAIKHLRLPLALLLIGSVGAALGLAQTARGPRRYSEDTARSWGTNVPRTAREAESHSVGTPTWTNTPGFERDAFTFARVHYSVDGSHGWGHSPPEDRWSIDFPDSDLNLSWRLQQVTSLKSDPDGRVIKITDKELFRYPFIYIVEAGKLTFTAEEIPILRRYLLNGGFLMFDDFWGDKDWESLQLELKKIFPDREPVELQLTHPIFHCVVDLPERPMVPGLPNFLEGKIADKPDVTESNYQGVFDDKGRLMVMICHNTDLGDGWEREGENEDYFRAYAEKFAYPMGINILFYAMTH